MELNLIFNGLILSTFKTTFQHILIWCLVVGSWYSH